MADLSVEECAGIRSKVAAEFADVELVFVSGVGLRAGAECIRHLRAVPEIDEALRVWRDGHAEADEGDSHPEIITALTPN